MNTPHVALLFSFKRRVVVGCSSSYVVVRRTNAVPTVAENACTSVLYYWYFYATRHSSAVLSTLTASDNYLCCLKRFSKTYTAFYA